MLEYLRLFVPFFLAVFALYWILPTQRLRVWLLLIASILFYRQCCETLVHCSDLIVWLIVGSSTLDYLIARRIDSSSRSWERRLLMTVTICSNLGLLCYFKYVNFFLHSLEIGLRSMGLERSFPTLSILLPIGISFYTFEAISYVVDVYRQKIRAERDWTRFLVFILFFPHLIAGPIVRGSDFLPQLQRFRRWNWARARLGLMLFAMGFIKKVAIGDRMGLLVDPVFADPGAFRPFVIWIAAFAYAVQIYADFSGYSDMAVGAAHLLGYRLTPNFNLPYLATSIADFWRRWHMSLSFWLRDYLFIPLGGSHGSRLRTCRNLILVMVLGGMWHGAHATLIVFGLANGIWLCAHRAFREWLQTRPMLDQALRSAAGTALRIAVTFFGITCLLTIFRATTLSVSATVLSRMFLFPADGRGEPYNLTIIGLLMAVFAVGYYLADRERWKRLADVVPPVLQGAACAVAMTAALVLTPEAGKVFIYFQF